MKRYSDFCTIPPIKQCNTNDEYYLTDRTCDGLSDCLDKTDENLGECGDFGCGSQLKIDFTSNLSDTDFLAEFLSGIYKWGGIHEHHPFYTRTAVDMFNAPREVYLFQSAVTRRWQIGLEMSESAIFTHRKRFLVEENKTFWDNFFENVYK